MLRLIIEGDESFNEADNSFEVTESSIIDLEHSLLSVSKWEAKHQKPFLTAGEKTSEEILDYLYYMVVTPDVGPDVLRRFSQENLNQVHAYIDSSQSATTFGAMPERRGSGETITSELVYFWMLTFNIPFECQLWHLNRLFALIRICNVKNSKPRKMSRNEIAQRNRELNEKRRKQLGTSG